MTVAVAAKVPWGSSVGEPSSLLFAADTRITFLKKQRPPVDDIRKLFVLNDGLAGVYSGLAEPAERAIFRLQRIFKQAKAVNFSEVRELSPSAFREAFETSSPKHPGLEVLIGGQEQSGSAFLLHASHRSNFFPIELSGEPFAIGEGAEQFRLNLQQAIRETLEAGLRELNWAALVSAAIDGLINHEERPTVGGKVALGAIIDGKFIEIPMGVGVGPSSSEITILRTATEQLDNLSWYHDKLRSRSLRRGPVRRR